MKALERIGVADAIRAENVPLSNVRLCRNDGRILKEFGFDECDGGEPELVGVERRRLQELMLEAVGDDKIVLDATVARVRLPPESPVPTAVLEDGRQVPCRMLIGADGVRSKVAEAVGSRPLSFVGQGGYRGIAYFDDTAPVAPRTVCQIWGDGSRAGLYPISDTAVYWFVCFDCTEEQVRMTPEEYRADALRMVDGWKHGIQECIENTAPEDVSRARFYERWQRPLGRAGVGNVTLAGDSLHPMTPNLGQGGCTALEDGIILARAVKACWASGSDDELQAALAAYESERAKRCLPIAVRSRVIGAVLQSPLPPMTYLRDNVVSRVLDPGHFFDHALYDCGDL